MKFHPIAEIFPMLSEEELDSLAEDIKANGLREPIWTLEDKILDGRNRFKACKLVSIEPKFREYRGNSPAAFVVSMNLKRRHLSSSQKACVAVEILPWFEREAKDRERMGKEKIPDPAAKGQARDKAGKSLGVNGHFVSDAKTIKEAAPSLFEQVKCGDKTMIEAKQELRRMHRDAKRQAAAVGIKLDDRIIVGDFRERSDAIPNGSLSLIFTDPPYDKESESLFENLAKFGSDKLADGGSLLCYVGHVQILSALESLSKYLRPWWVCACVHSGGKGLMREYGIRVGWKPILWFVKGTRHDKTQIVLDTVTGGREKDHHDWQQAQDEAVYWIGNLCSRDGIVCDPFLGGGTTAAAAEDLSRKWIGFEIDPETAARASQRITAK